MTEWVQAISTVGFPIAAAAYMSWLNKTQSERFDKRFDALVEKNTTDSDAIALLKETVDNNTKALLVCADRMKGGSEYVTGDRLVTLE